jgi:hypothetical protein
LTLSVRYEDRETDSRILATAQWRLTSRKPMTTVVSLLGGTCLTESSDGVLIHTSRFQGHGWTFITLPENRDLISVGSVLDATAQL